MMVRGDECNSAVDLAVRRTYIVSARTSAVQNPIKMVYVFEYDLAIYPRR